MTSHASRSATLVIALLDEIAASIAIAFTRLCRAAVLELQRRKEARTLRALDDRMLADIGLQRGQIDRAVRSGRHGLISSASGF